MTFPEYARQARQAAGISQQQVADACALPHRSNVTKREKGRIEWKFSEVEALAGLLGVGLVEFVEGYENSQKPR